MNQTMKLALGITGVCSVLALLIPQNFSPPTAEPEPVSLIEQPISDPLPSQFQPAPLETVSEQFENEQDFSFGDPTASADPIDFNDDFSGNSRPSANSNDDNQTVSPRSGNDAGTISVSQPVSNRPAATNPRSSNGAQNSSGPRIDNILVPARPPVPVGSNDLTGE